MFTYTYSDRPRRGGAAPAEARELSEALVFLVLCIYTYIYIYIYIYICIYM